LRLSEEDFWQLTLREFMGLLKRCVLKIERFEYSVGLICSTYANCHRDPKSSKVFTPQDFMPKKEEMPKRKKQTPEEMLAVVRLWNAALGGKEV
jgi:hypothetical protein